MSLSTQIAALATRVGQEVKSLWTAVGTKAPLASPALTGTPTAPTASAGTATTQIATTEFVSTAMSTLGGGVPDGGVTTVKLADGAVTTAKIADGNVTNAKLVNSSVTVNGSVIALGGSATVEATPSDLSVTTGKIAQFAVTQDRIASGAIANGQIAANAGIEQSKIEGLTTTLAAKANMEGTLAQFGSTTSAQLASVVSDETGSGALVFGTGPTISTPILTLDSTSSTTNGRIAWNQSQDKIIVGDGSAAVEFAPSTLLFTSQSAAYTVALTDKDRMVEMGSASALTLTVPNDSTSNFPIGSQINILQTGAGQLTIAGASGVTVNATPGLKLRAQWSSATLIKRAANVWVLIGDLTA